MNYTKIEGQEFKVQVFLVIELLEFLEESFQPERGCVFILVKCVFLS